MSGKRIVTLAVLVLMSVMAFAGGCLHVHGEGGTCMTDEQRERFAHEVWGRSFGPVEQQVLKKRRFSRSRISQDHQPREFGITDNL